jgi:hypothetical protein
MVVIAKAGTELLALCSALVVEERLQLATNEPLEVMLLRMLHGLELFLVGLLVRGIDLHLGQENRC